MDQQPPHELQQLLAVLRGYQRSQAVAVVAELGIADLLREGPRGADELSAATGTHTVALYRLLRALASIGIFAESDGRRFALSPMGRYLCRDHPLSVEHVIEAAPVRFR